ncbi:efflux RND transporter periplasmic adaptor subunit [Paludibaculum fermentans]|uniref:efflux RND transporter periplasmic adaptor subunit n=1 Tax=Paludibaculum fermentans TaxID=1473598 RepID=UPI003EB6F636
MNRIALIVPLCALAACQRHQAPAGKTITPVRVAAVDTYQPKSAARYSATILPARQVSLAFRVSGLVRNIYRLGSRGLEPGDIVPAGAVLARLREEDFNHSATQASSQLAASRESLKGAAAQLQQMQASQAKADADFARAQALFESQSLTRPEFDAAKAQRDVAAAQVAAAQANVDTAAHNVRNAEGGLGTARLAQVDTALVAPFVASVVQRNIEVGMLAGPSQIAYSLADIGTVKAVFGVPDTVVVQLRPGRPIDLTVEALPGRGFKGAITSIAAVADSETRLFQVEVDIANHDRQLKPGMIAALELQERVDTPPVPVVPLSAVVRDQTSPANFAVMVVDGKMARSRRVALGPTFGELLAVTHGLKPGELVISAGGTLVKDGDAVEVVR